MTLEPRRHLPLTPDTGAPSRRTGSAGQRAPVRSAGLSRDVVGRFALESWRVLGRMA